MRRDAARRPLWATTGTRVEMFRAGEGDGEVEERIYRNVV